MGSSVMARGMAARNLCETLLLCVACRNDVEFVGGITRQRLDCLCPPLIVGSLLLPSPGSAYPVTEHRTRFTIALRIPLVCQPCAVLPVNHVKSTACTLPDVIPAFAFNAADISDVMTRLVGKRPSKRRDGQWRGLRNVGHLFKRPFTGGLLVCNFEALGTTHETGVPGQV